MITQIWVDHQELDLYSDTNIKHVRQANDIAELKNRQASYTNSFSIPKTPNNVQIFGGLGIPSDTSRIPYLKPDCRIKIEGFDFIVKGWMNVTETNEEYKIYVYSGIVNFFKAIENKTLGDQNLGIAEIDHDKNLQSVIDSFTNPYYKYLITDYNGRTHYGDDNQIINIDHLVPSVNVEYLWKRIHNTEGFTYSGKIFENERFKNLWITFPKYIDIESLSEVAKNSGTKYIGTTNINTSDANNYYQPLQVQGYINSQYFLIPEDGDYKLTFSINSNPNFGRKEYLLCVNQQNIPLSQRSYDPIVFTDEERLNVSEYRIAPYQAGDLVSIVVKFDRIPNGVVNWEASYDLKWAKFNKGGVSFSQELRGFSRKDFVKEIINHFGLTMLTDEFSNNVEYLTLEERINQADVVDWSDRYIERTSESYVYQSYAQKNTLSYQYNDKESNHNDSIIPVNNKNIEEKKEIFKSKMYSPEREFSYFRINDELTQNLNVFKFYDKEPEEKDGKIEIKYKGLEKRYHFIRENTIEAEATVGSYALEISQKVSSLPLASFKNLHFRDIISDNYNIFGQILNDSRLHEIDLNLSYTDILQIDFKKLYFFQQQQQYYLLNRLSFDNNKAKGEFVRVKKHYDSIDIIDPVDPIKPFINIVWDDDTNIPRSGSLENITLKVSSKYAQDNDPFVSFEWQRDNNHGFIDQGQGTSPYTFNLLLGNNKFRLKGMTQSGQEVFSNPLSYKRIFVFCKKYEAVTHNYQDLIIEYLDCEEKPRRVVIGGNTYTKRHEFCAKDGSVNTNGELEDLGLCM